MERTLLDLAELAEADLRATVRELPTPSLEALAALLGLEGCACQLRVRPCPDCGAVGLEDCACPMPALVADDPDSGRIVWCEHMRQGLALPDVPYAIQAEILLRLRPKIYEDKPPAPEFSRVQLRQAKVEVLAQRRKAGRSLWHPLDFLGRDSPNHYDPKADRLGRIMDKRGPSGHDRPREMILERDKPQGKERAA